MIDNEIYICKTVLLKTEWVLRFSYELSEQVILAALKNVVGLPQVTVENAPSVADALGMFEGGVDFADAMHLCSGPEDSPFATFDKRMKRGVNKVTPDRHIEMV